MKTYNILGTALTLLSLAMLCAVALAFGPMPASELKTTAYTLEATNRVYTATNNITQPAVLIGWMRQMGCLDATINTLATSGEFCRVRRHIWQDVPIITYSPSVTGKRICGVCGATQHKVTTEEWR